MKYFSIKELIRSNEARKRGIDNTPSEEVILNLTVLIENLLDPLREAYGKSIFINSGYRSPELNKAVGGVPTSHHLSGKAADLTTKTKKGNKALFDLIQSLNLPFTQLIDESNFAWVHVSYDANNLKKQILKL